MELKLYLDREWTPIDANDDFGYSRPFAVATISSDGVQSLILPRIHDFTGGY